MTGAFGQPDQSDEFIDIALEDYPLTIEMIRADTNEVVETINVPGPGAVNIKPWSTLLGGVHILARVTTARGDVQIEG